LFQQNIQLFYFPLFSPKHMFVGVGFLPSLCTIAKPDPPPD